MRTTSRAWLSRPARTSSRSSTGRSGRAATRLSDRGRRAARAAQLAEFWRRPDGERPFATWLRELLEDLLVIDAPALELRRNRGGELIGLDVVDGATIKVLFDETGRRPRPPAPAFEQMIHGRPWKLLTGDELLYLPRNPRPHKAYGFGPVEQIVMTVNIALRRQVDAAAALHRRQCAARAAQRAGRLERRADPPVPGMVRQRARRQYRRRARASSGGRAGAKYQPFKEAPYKDEFDEWLARIVCYAFSLPPTAFIRQINRATAETAAGGRARPKGWRR